ncbi:MAG: hypothetical protein ACK5O2_04485 [Microthrixaceae bacterium]
MEHLPHVGWADVATKRDLDHLEERLGPDFRHEFDGMRHEFDGLRHDNDSLHKDLEPQIAEFRNPVTSQQLRHTIALVGILGTLMAILDTFG